MNVKSLTKLNKELCGEYSRVSYSATYQICVVPRGTGVVTCSPSKTVFYVPIFIHLYLMFNPILSTISSIVEKL